MIYDNFFDDYIIIWFSLFPNEFQPWGYINFGLFSNPMLNIYNINNYENIKIIYRFYNVLRITTNKKSVLF